MPTAFSHRTRTGVSFALVVALSVVVLASASPASALVVGHYRSATNNAATFNNYRWSANHEQVVDLQPWDTAQLYKLKAANPAIIVLMYENASAASSWPASNGEYDTGVSYDQARTADWLLYNTSGSTFTFNGYSWLWAADIGSGAYQDAWVANVETKLRSAPWDGVMIDDVNPTIKYHYCVSCVAKYPSDQQYGGAMGSFVQSVGSRLQADGYLAVANLGSWPAYTSVVNPWLRWLSGGMDENFVKWGTNPDEGYVDPTTWRTQLDEISTTESQNKLFLALTTSAWNDERAAVYGFATTLLAGAGHTMYWLVDANADETWFPEYGYPIGDPTGSYTIDSDGVYRRYFTNGVVLVNPTGSNQTVSFGGTYSGSGLSDANGTTMAPQTGLVLYSSDSTGTIASCDGAFNIGFNAGFQVGFQSGFQIGWGAGGWAAGDHSGGGSRKVSRACAGSFNYAFNRGYNRSFNVGFDQGFNARFLALYG